MNFSLPAKSSENKRNRKTLQIPESYKRAEKSGKHEDNGDVSCSRNLWNITQSNCKIAGRNWVSEKRIETIQITTLLKTSWVTSKKTATSSWNSDSSKTSPVDLEWKSLSNKRVSSFSLSLSLSLSIYTYIYIYIYVCVCVCVRVCVCIITMNIEFDISSVCCLWMLWIWEDQRVLFFVFFCFRCCFFFFRPSNNE